MTRAVYRLDDKGKRVYLGHVPEEYELRDGEHFYPRPEDAEVIEDKETLEILKQFNKYRRKG